jgi:plasmid stabilization system protein ParE
MPRVRLAAQAQFDLVRLHQFLDEKDAVTANRAILVIRQAFKTLEYAPVIYRPAHDDPSFREMVIEFGASGYVALYDYDSAAQVSTIYAVKHQLENDYKLWPTRA